MSPSARLPAYPNTRICSFRTRMGYASPREPLTRGRATLVALPVTPTLQPDVDLFRVVRARPRAGDDAGGCVAEEPGSVAERVHRHGNLLLLPAALAERPSAAEHREAETLRLHDSDVDGIAVACGTDHRDLRRDLVRPRELHVLRELDA